MKKLFIEINDEESKSSALIDNDDELRNEIGPNDREHAKNGCVALLEAAMDLSTMLRVDHRAHLLLCGCVRLSVRARRGPAQG